MVGAPLTIGSYMSFSLGVGGSPFFIYTYIVCFVFQMFVCLSVAEIASCYLHTLGMFLAIVYLTRQPTLLMFRSGQVFGQGL